MECIEKIRPWRGVKRGQEALATDAGSLAADPECDLWVWRPMNHGCRDPGSMMRRLMNQGDRNPGFLSAETHDPWGQSG